MRRLSIAVKILAFVGSLLLAGGCGGGSSLPSRSPEEAPIVPGFSLAQIDIDATFSSVKEIYGEPDEKVFEEGYLHVYYQRLNETVERDYLGAWHMVVILYDNGNGELDGEDRVGQIEVSKPYYGKTNQGNGMGSTSSQLEEEFGPCEYVSRLDVGGKAFLDYSYARRGIEFVLEEESQQVITVVVTAYGGLRPATNQGNPYSLSVGEIFPATGNEPIMPGESVAGIRIGDPFFKVKDIYGLPNLTGNTGEVVYATYTGGTSSWKLNVYLEDTDEDRRPGDYDVVISICVRFPYAGKTSRGVGIGSRMADVQKEFGPPQIQERSILGAEVVLIWQYPDKGIVLAIEESSGKVVEIDVNKV